MPSGNAPTVRQRRIGSALRKARDHRNLTVATAAGRFGRSQGWLSMVENGLQTIAPNELSALLDFYAIKDGPLRESLLHLATQNSASGNGHMRTGSPPQRSTWPAWKRTPPRSATSSRTSSPACSRFRTTPARSSLSGPLHTRATSRCWSISGSPASTC
ncbi:XRE family transcriptional regulator [Actinomadura sp. KC06]|nr:XRE family transcriptional regulator [Actinomadura sp. KC06]